jgi:hypothetical protein
MTFPAPCAMPHKPTILPTKQNQPTLDRYFTRKHITSTIHQPTETNRSTTPTSPNNEAATTSYRHPAIIAVTFDTRGIHNTIMDLHHILNSKQRPTIIHLTETKHSHVKSI